MSMTEKIIINNTGAFLIRRHVGKSDQVPLIVRLATTPTLLLLLLLQVLLLLRPRLLLLRLRVGLRLRLQ